MDTKKDILRRIYLLYFLFSVVAILIAGQLIKIQFFEGPEWKEMAKETTTRYSHIEAIRGNIYASDGSLFATSLPIYEIRMDANTDGLTNDVFYSGLDSLAAALSGLFRDKSMRDYRQMLKTARTSDNRYLLIRRNVTYPQLKELKKFPLFRMGRYKGGFIYVQRNKRVRPFQLLAARTIGYDLEETKPVGIEATYDRFLSGVSGMRLMQRVAGGVWKPINDDNEIEPQDGFDINTTIDVNIQDVAEDALLNQLIKHNADHGCVVLMEVQTGEIRAIANLSRDNLGNYYEYFNYAVGESMEPGSIFKLASIMVGLEDGCIRPGDSVDTENGSTKYYDQTMRDSRKGGYGKITVEKAFEVSSNVGISKIIFENYRKRPQRFIDRLCRMNLNTPSGIDIPGEVKPLIKNPSDKDWSGTTLPWMAIGYEVRFTPLQMLTFYNAVANNGKMVAPMIVKEVVNKGKTIQKFSPRVINSSIASRAAIRQAKELLEGVVENGTAVNLKNSVCKIAGKTGTVQIANGKYGYRYKSETLYQASFAGYFPADNPMYSCIVVINAPSNDVYYGNLVAGPIFKEVAGKVFSTTLGIHKDIGHNELARSVPYVKGGKQSEIINALEKLDIEPAVKDEKFPWAIAINNDSVLRVLPRKVEEELNAGYVPDLTGMNAEDAVFLLENYGLKVKISGGGAIKWQSLEPGSRILRGREIVLELS